MNHDPLEVLSAFIDGEESDPHALAQALCEPGAREILRDFALLRAEVLSDDGRPDAGFYATMERRLGNRGRLRQWWATPLRVPIPVVVAAGVALLVVGLWAGADRIRESLEHLERPPRADRVVRFVPDVSWHEE